MEWRLFGFGMVRSSRLFPVEMVEWRLRTAHGPPATELPSFTLRLSAGSILFGLDHVAKPGQRFPARVGIGLGAGTVLGVPVSAAARAEPFAVFHAQGSGRQGQKHLFAQNILKQETVLLIITDFGLVRRDGALGGGGIGFVLDR